MRVGILGTGKMGGAMARRLHGAGHELTLWNRTPSRAEALGIGKVTSTPAGAARDAEVVISMLTNAEAVRGAYLGDAGAAGVARDQVFIEMSTAGTEVNREIGAAVGRGGADFVEAPVLGSVGAIEGGSAVILAAGTEKAVGRARPVLQAFGDVRHIGAVGSAAALKLVANSMLAGVYTLTSELLTAGVAAGLPVEEVFFVLNRIVPLLSQRKAGFVEHRYEPVTFTMRDTVKDLDLARELFTSIGASTPLTDSTRELYRKAARTHGDKEMSAIMSLYEAQPAGRKT